MILDGAREPPREIHFQSILYGVNKEENNKKIQIRIPFFSYSQQIQSKDTINAAYRGETINGNPNGIGRFYFTLDGENYEGSGNFVHGKLHGRASIMNFNSGLTWYCDYKEGVMHGNGMMCCPQVTSGIVSNPSVLSDVSGWPIYIGNYKNGLRHGLYAEYDKSDGKVVIIPFENGKPMPGDARVLTPSGEEYIQWE